MLFAAESRLDIIGCWFQLAAVATWPHGMMTLEDEIFIDFNRGNVKVLATKNCPSAEQLLTNLWDGRKLSTIQSKEVLLLLISFLWPVSPILSFCLRQSSTSSYFR